MTLLRTCAEAGACKVLEATKKSSLSEAMSKIILAQTESAKLQSLQACTSGSLPSHPLFLANVTRHMSNCNG